MLLYAGPGRTLASWSFTPGAQGTGPMKMIQRQHLLKARAQVPCSFDENLIIKQIEGIENSLLHFVVTLPDHLGRSQFTDELL